MYTLYIEDIHGGQTHEHAFEDGELIVGRSRETSDIVLPSDNVSRRHARLYTADDVCYVQDLSSANGVFVDGVRIRDVHELESSSRVRVGDYVLQVSCRADEKRQGENELARFVGEAKDGAARVQSVRESVALVGRGKDTAITVVDPSVSRVHAKLTRDDAGDFFLQDLKSSNGTYVNDIAVEQHKLRFGDRVRFGNAEFDFEGPKNAIADQDTALHSARVPDIDEEPLRISNDRPRFRWGVVFLVVLLLGVVGLLAFLFVTETQGPKASSARTPVPTNETTRQTDSPAAASHEETPASGTQAVEQTPSEPFSKPTKTVEDNRKLAQTAAEERRWTDSEKYWEALLQADIHDEDATKSLVRVREERANAARLPEADRQTREHDYLGALASLRQVTQGSVYRGEAQARIKAISALMPQYRDAAVAAFRRRNLPLACEQLAWAGKIDSELGKPSGVLKRRLKRLKRKCRRFTNDEGK